MVRPLLAGSGAAPQRWAKAASERDPVGVVAGGDQELRGDLGADPVKRQQWRARPPATSWPQLGVELVDLGAQVPVCAGRVDAGRAWWRRWSSVLVAGPEPGAAAVIELGGVECRTLAQLGRAGDHQRLELVRPGCAALTA